MTKELALLTVAGKDRPGIIAMVTGILYRCGGNLEDISMTILDRQFAMMVIVALHDRKKKKAEKALSGYQKKWGLTFFWTDLKPGARDAAKKQKSAEKYLITAMGRDKTGIVYKVSDTLAGKGLNITDLNSRILGQGKNAVYAMMLEADIPQNFPLQSLQKTLNTLQKKLGIEIALKPVEGLEF